MTVREKITSAMQERKTAYQLTFQPETPAGKAVLEDLGKFCRAAESTFQPSERAHCLLEGRREVFLRIYDFLSLSVEELCAKYGGPQWQVKAD